MEAAKTAINSNTQVPAAMHAVNNMRDQGLQMKEDKRLLQSPPPSSFIQKKLTIGSVDDPLEKEADDMADKVMRMALPGSLDFSSIGNTIQRRCAHCEEEEKLQRKESSGESASIAPSIVHDVLNSFSGKSLDTDTRLFMEPRFGYDFGNVKIHDNALAAKSASAINALAYTSGNNIVFGSGQYDTHSDSGKRLMAHELTHVVQQGNWIATKIQRLGDLNKVPTMACDVPDTSAPASEVSSLFSTSSTSLSVSQKSNIALFVTNWKNNGAKDPLRVDGYASTSGADEMNWQLSCDRALSVANELRNNGVPDNLITIFAQGETSEFGSQGNNQRADVGIIGAPAPPTPPAPVPLPTITSETVVTSPAPRSRILIGVGEEVKLTQSAGNATTTWSTTAGQLKGIGSAAPVGPSVILTAPDVGLPLVVSSGGAIILFFVIPPTDVHMDRFPGTGIKHTINRADIGIETLPFLLPDTVNFNKVTYHELDVAGTTAAPFPCGLPPGHCGAGGGGAVCSDLALTDTVVAGKGTQAVVGDCAFMGSCGTTPPFTPVTLTINIPYEYKVGAGPFHSIRTVPQVHALLADASTLTTDKAGAHGDTTVAAGTGTAGPC